MLHLKVATFHYFEQTLSKLVRAKCFPCDSRSVSSVVEQLKPNRKTSIDAHLSLYKSTALYSVEVMLNISRQRVFSSTFQNNRRFEGGFCGKIMNFC